jgi:hypothetical protein
VRVGEVKTREGEPNGSHLQSILHIATALDLS